MGLAITRKVGQSFWIGDDWFKVTSVNHSKPCDIVDRHGVTLQIGSEKPVKVKPEVSIRQGFSILPSEVKIVFDCSPSVKIWRDELVGPKLLVPPDQTEVALLASVPYQHLHSALKTAKEFGKVAFGSMAFETLGNLESEVAGLRCPVLIYASRDGAPYPPTASWRASFVGVVGARSNGTHPEGVKFRPESAASDSSWAVFWEVADLSQVGAADGWQMDALRSFRTGAPLARAFKPNGPTLIENPFLDSASNST